MIANKKQTRERLPLSRKKRGEEKRRRNRFLRKQRNREKGDKRKGRNKKVFLENEESWGGVFPVDKEVIGTKPSYELFGGELSSFIELHDSIESRWRTEVHGGMHGHRFAAIVSVIEARKFAINLAADWRNSARGTVISGEFLVRGPRTRVSLSLHPCGSGWSIDFSRHVRPVMDANRIDFSLSLSRSMHRGFHRCGVVIVVDAVSKVILAVILTLAGN